MTFRVVWSKQATNELARWWATSTDRAFVHQAKQTVIQILGNDATKQGMELSEGLRFVDILPLRFYFNVDLELAVAEVESVARFRDQSL